MTLVVDSLKSAVASGRLDRVDSDGASPPKKGARPSDLLKENDGWIDGKFRLLEKLGEGGFGLVYKAEQTQPIHRLVAVKVLKAGMDTQQVIARFETERQSLALMEHPNIARVLDAGETARGQPYFVMELVRGRSITSYAANRELGLRERIELFIPVCQAVNHAHQKGIIHRDLKPSNVMVMEDEGVPTPKVIDFGIAKVLEQKDVSQTLVTGMDQLVGTPGYISPEQIEHGSSHVDTRSDVYALGSILMELLTGKALVTPMDVAQKPMHQILRDQVERDPPRPSTREPSLKGDLDWIILKALEREPARRYGSAFDLAEDLRRFLNHKPVLACPPSKRYLLGKFVRRHRVGVAASAALAFAILSGGITSTALYIEYKKKAEEASRGREEVRREFSRSDEQIARQLTGQTEYSDAVARFCRALDTDPGNKLASVNLLSLLAHIHLVHPTTPELTLPTGALEAKFVALSRPLECVLAVSAPNLGGTRTARSDVLSIWQKGRLEPANHLLPAGAGVMALKVTRNGRHALLALDNGTVEMWSLENGTRKVLSPAMPPPLRAGEVAGSTDKPVQSVLCLTLSGDGNTLAAGGDDGSILVWDLRQPERPALQMRQGLPATGDLPEGVRLPPNVTVPISNLTADYLGTVVASVSNLGTVTVGEGVVGDPTPVLTPSTTGLVTVWDALAGEQIGGTQVLEDLITSVALNRGRELITVGLDSGMVHVANYRQEQEVLQPLTHPAPVNCLTVSSSGASLFVGDNSGYLHAWNLASGQPRFPAQRHHGDIMMLTQGLERGMVASMSRFGELQVWNVQTGERVRQLMHHSVADVAITPDCAMLALAPRQQPYVQAWSICDRMVTRRFLAPSKESYLDIPALDDDSPTALRQAVARTWSRDGSLAAAADGTGMVTVFNLRGGQQVGERFQHPPAVGALAISQDGTRVVTSGRDQEVRFWDVQTGRFTGLALRHKSFVTALALSQDNERLVTVTEEGEIRVWDARTGDCLTPPILQGAGLTDMHISDDGLTMIFRKEDEGWFSLPMPPEAARLPTWFLRLAEGVALQRLDEGQMRRLDLDDLARLAAAVPKTVPAAEALALRWARWLLADPEQRPLHPLDDEPFDTYVQSLVNRNEPEALAEAVRYRPDAALKETGGR